MKNKKNTEINILAGMNGIEKMIIISGRDEGKKQRKKFKLDLLDKDENNYSIVIPQNIISLNPSFFLGAFGPSVRYFGEKEKFLEKYNFIDNETVLKSIFDGIRDALNNVDAM